MKLKEVFEKSVQFFKDKKIESARLDAELLISHVLKIDRIHIYVKYDQPLSEMEIQNCREVIRRRAQGEPVAYITGQKGFFGENFNVGEGVLIPRPETELLVEDVLDFIKVNKIAKPRILDLGAGSGCIGFSILKNCESASLVSIEKSEAAYKYLKTNQQYLNLAERSQIILKDVMDADLNEQKFDIIVANPPYIAEDDIQIEDNVKNYEPHMALFSSNMGFEAHLNWSEKYRHYLAKPGLMIFEMGYQQGSQLKLHFESFKQFDEVKIVKDLSELDRFIKSTQYQ